MELRETQIKGAYIIEHDSFEDERGFFYEILDKDILTKLGSPELNKVNISHSKYGVLRGLHYQVQQPQVKFVSCIKGKVMDFAVDVRESSDSFGEIIQFDLNEEKSETLFLPVGVAHGFLSLSRSVLLYLVSGTYLKELERGINYKSLDIKLPIKPLVINSRDKNWPNFDEAEYCN